jgi:glycosyltransferase involved in cell wall biosynthesis
LKNKSIKPKVTVYITNYNYGKFLTKAIDSVLEQTFTEFELIIIDDGSNDNSHDIINNYSNKENIYTVFQKNRGLNASNNVALSLAQGEYIIRLDADDYFAPQAIELMVSELDRNMDCALIFPDYYNIDENGNIIEEIKRHNFSKDVKLFDQPAHGACTLIRSKILKSIGGYDEEFNRQDGYDIWLKITELYRVKNISLPLFYYRQHSKSITKNEKKLYKTRTKIINKNLNKKNVEDLKVLSIIPVRGENTDPSLKPLDNIGGKELINWTIESALKSSLLENVVVTGNDLKLKNFIKTNWGKKVIWIDRDENLSAMNTGIEKTAIDITKKYEKNHSKVDTILMLYIEYPFRSSMYIDQAINVMQLFKVDSVSTVRKDDDMFFIHTGEGLKPWHRSKNLRLERDELYRRSGGLHLIRKEVLIKNKNMLYGKMGHVAVDEEAAFKVKSKNSYKYLDKLNTKK